MTNPSYGSSLFQARKTQHHNYRHSSLHNRIVNGNHIRSHADFHNKRQDAAELDSAITEVVQTVSIVQVIDDGGSTIEVQTQSSTPQTNIIDGVTGSTIEVAVGVATVTPASSSDSSPTAILSALPVQASSTSASLTSQDYSETVTSTFSSFSSCSSTFPALDAATNSSSITVIPSSSTFIPAYTTINGTITANSRFLSSSSSSLSSSSTSFSSSSSFSSTLLSSFTSSSSTSSSTESSTSTTSLPSSTWSSLSSTRSSASATKPASTTDLASSTGSGTDSTSIYATPFATETSTSDGGSSDGSPVQTSRVVGGIIGGLAGIALLVALAFMILKWKKRGVGHLRLGEDGSIPASKALRPTNPGPGGNDNGAYGTMQQRSSPYVVPSALAALAGGKRTSRSRSRPPAASPSSQPGERGFVRVSGKKLPPVLQFGGDGYTDPRDRDSAGSDISVYRDSMAIFNQGNPTQLTLGSPMRPESGVMVMNPGPRKLPVTERAPLDSPTLPRSTTFPVTSTDALGRTLVNEDYSRAGSRGSGTRFTEHMS